MKRAILAMLLLGTLAWTQTVPPDLNGTWLISSSIGAAPVVMVLQRTGNSLVGRIETATVAYPITASIASGTPNPNVLSIRITEHTSAALLIWQAYTTGPDSLQGVTPTDVARSATLDYVNGYWTATRFNPAPTVLAPSSPPVLTDSDKLDQITKSGARIEAALQAVLDYLRNPVPVTPAPDTLAVQKEGATR